MNKIYFNHIAGDGRHFITNSGITSDICILSNLQVLSIFHDIPDVSLMWTEAYPNDPMTYNNIAKITFAGVVHSEYFDTESLDSILSLLADLDNIGCEQLARVVRKQLEEKGIV